jgi:A/G-specific adenine glycosylase
VPGRGLDAARLHPATVGALRRRVFAWYAEHRRDLPWRRTTDPYAVLVSEIMLQQTQVSRVVPRFEPWMARYPNLEALAAAPLRDVLAEWSGLGYNNRAERLRRAAQSVAAAALGGGGSSTAAALPATVEELRRLPGVGPYTARAVLVFAHNADLAAVDANVRRVLTHELGLPHDLTPAALRTVAERVLPRGRARDWHNALMDYGAQVLTGRATGIRAPRRQAPFEGSRRWYRSRALRLMLDGGPLEIPSLAAALGLPEDETVELVALLERDGLAHRRGRRVTLA